MTVYLDCNATTPIDPRVSEFVIRFLKDDFGNAGSRTHEFGTSAKQALERAREQVARPVDARLEEVIFTSGATESNNIAILGLAKAGIQNGKRHLVSTQIEHKAVLEPLARLREHGFNVTLVPPTVGGWVRAEAVLDAVRDDTLLVSVMHVNNETGVIQPLSEIARGLEGRDTFFHVDAAQGFGKSNKTLRNPRIDLISISGHKIFGPKGVGALVTRRRGFNPLPLTPLIFGGGQERGLRPGTVPVHLVVGLGVAAELAAKEESARKDACMKYRQVVLSALTQLEPHLNGDAERTLPHVLNLSFPGVDSEAAMLALKGVVAISNGSACTSEGYEPSHVLAAMGLEDEVVRGALRISWCHMTEGPDWGEVASLLGDLL